MPGAAPSTKANLPDGDSGPWVKCEPLWEFLFLQMQSLPKMHTNSPHFTNRPAPWPAGGVQAPRPWLRAPVTRRQAVQCRAGALPSLSPGAAKYSPTRGARPQHRACPQPAGSWLGGAPAPLTRPHPLFRAAPSLLLLHSPLSRRTKGHLLFETLPDSPQAEQAAPVGSQDPHSRAALDSLSYRKRPFLLPIPAPARPRVPGGQGLARPSSSHPLSGPWRVSTPDPPASPSAPEQPPSAAPHPLLALTHPPGP